jgi:altronate dehydratase small subunit
MSEKITSQKSCFQVSPGDNVATLLCNVIAGDEITVQGAGSSRRLAVCEAIQLGHKVAIERVAKDVPIVKYGVPIGLATVSVKPGEWVHLHNCRSQVDERSSRLDPGSGAAKDTPYV